MSRLIRRAAARGLQTSTFRKRQKGAVFAIRAGLIACAAATVALSSTYRIAEAQITIVDVSFYEEPERVFDEIKRLLQEVKCLPEWRVDELLGRIDNARTALSAGIKDIDYATFARLNPGQEGQMQQARDRGNGLRVSLYFVGEQVRAFPRCLHFVGQPPGRVKLKDEEERVEIGSSGRAWTGPYFGGSLGARGTNTDVTNQNQITFLVPDARPNPTSFIHSTRFYGNVFFGYNSIIPLGSTERNLLFGIEGFAGTGNNSSTIRGIPGTGGIATPAVMANDSTTVKETWDAGILGRIGTIVPIGNSPVSLSFLGGVGFLKVDLDANCTAAGACGTNFIPAQTLSISKTMTGLLLGLEAGMPLASVLGSPSSTESSAGRVLRTANIRFQYLHGDYGNATATIGNPAQIQLTINQHVTTDTFTAGLVVPFSVDDEIRRYVKSGAILRR